MVTTKGVLVVDDDPFIRHHLRGIISRSGVFNCVGEARNGAEAISLYTSLQPDLVLMDLHMPVIGGVEATRQICTSWPQAKVVIMTVLDPAEQLASALEAGALGFLIKGATESLIEDLGQAVNGDPPFSGRVRRYLVTQLLKTPLQGDPIDQVRFTDRELELLECLALGMTNRQIGRTMCLSEGTVKQYLLNISQKLGVNSRTAVLVQALSRCLIDVTNLKHPGGRVMGTRCLFWAQLVLPGLCTTIFRGCRSHALKMGRICPGKQHGSDRRRAGQLLACSSP